MSALPRVALVVGQTDYKGLPRLPKAQIDAANIADELEDCGFDVIPAFNVTTQSFFEKLTDLEQKVSALREKPPLVLFYYAGHGAEYHKHFRMLTTEYEGSTDSGEQAAAPAPTAAAAAAKQASAAVQAASVSSEEVLRHMLGADRCVFILDACRTKPAREVTYGTKHVSVPQLLEESPPTLWADACWSGSTTPDINSFGSILLQELFKPGVTIYDAVGRANEHRAPNAGTLVCERPHMFNFSLVEGCHAACDSDTHPPAATENKYTGPTGSYSEQQQQQQQQQCPWKPANTEPPTAEFDASSLKADIIQLQERLEGKRHRNSCMVVVENRTRWELARPSTTYFGSSGEPYPDFGFVAIQPMTGCPFVMHPKNKALTWRIRYKIGGSSRFLYLHWNPRGHDPKQATGASCISAPLARVFKTATKPSWRAEIGDDQQPEMFLWEAGMDQVNKAVSNEYCVEDWSVKVSGRMDVLHTGMPRLWVRIGPAAPLPRATV